MSIFAIERQCGEAGNFNSTGIHQEVKKVLTETLNTREPLFVHAYNGSRRVQ